jgi:hypothetical protein
MKKFLILLRRFSCEKLMLNYHLIYFAPREHYSAHLFFEVESHTEKSPPSLSGTCLQGGGKKIALARCLKLAKHIFYLFSPCLKAANRRDFYRKLRFKSSFNLNMFSYFTTSIQRLGMAFRKRKKWYIVFEIVIIAQRWRIQKATNEKEKKKSKDLFTARASIMASLEFWGSFDIQKLINFENVKLHERVCIAQSIINNNMNSPPESSRWRVENTKLIKFFPFLFVGDMNFFSVELWSRIYFSFASW